MNRSELRELIREVILEEELLSEGDPENVKKAREHLVSAYSAMGKVASNSAGASFRYATDVQGKITQAISLLKFRFKK